MKASQLVKFLNEYISKGLDPNVTLSHEVVMDDEFETIEHSIPTDLIYLKYVEKYNEIILLD